MPLSLHKELATIQATLAPGAPRRRAYLALQQRLEHQREQARVPQARYALSLMIHKVTELARTEPGAGAQGEAL